jgi:hypothetical protein
MQELTIEDAKRILEKNGYFVANLWHVEDVTINYECDEDMAQEILYKALTNDHVMEAIWDSINYFTEDLERK